MLDPRLDTSLGKARPDCAVVELALLPAHDVRLPAIRWPDLQRQDQLTKCKGVKRSRAKSSRA
jgi:hypothetical protein